VSLPTTTCGLNVRGLRTQPLSYLKSWSGGLPRSGVPVTSQVASPHSFSGTEAIEFEKIIGINNLKQIAWIEQGVHVSRAVCRVLTPNGLGTGFLIGQDRLMMTNSHVIDSAATARQAKIEFNYQMSLRPPASHRERCDMN